MFFKTHFLRSAEIKRKEGFAGEFIDILKTLFLLLLLENISKFKNLNNSLSQQNLLKTKLLGL